MSTTHKFPAVHNAMWPGLVGKGPDSEPPIELDRMLDMTAAANVDGVRFDGVDLFLSLPHTSIDSSDDDLKQLADKLNGHGLLAGSLVAPVWGATGGGSAMGSDEERKKFLEQVEKACRIGRKLRDLGVRQYGVIRIDSAASPEEWSKDPEGSTAKIAQTFREAGVIAANHGEKLAAEGEICWAGMHGTDADGGHAADRRLSGGHGTHHVVHHGLQRAGRPAAAGEFRVGAG
jgi:sugar phosphate isomerase/epimerase